MGREILKSGFKDKFEEEELARGILVPKPRLTPEEFLKSYKEVLNTENSFKLHFNEGNVHLSDPFWEDAVRGKIRDRLVPYILRARKEVKDEEEFGYRWKKQQEIAGWKVEQEHEKTVTAWDIKTTPNNKVKILEFHEFWFGVEGFETAFQYGSIEQDIKECEGCRGGFSRFLIIHANNKHLTHQVIGELMPSLVEGEFRDDDLVVVKPGYGESGVGIKIIKASELKDVDKLKAATQATPFQDELVEEFVTGKDIYVNGERYEGCMRYVTCIEVETDKLVLTDLGGYWRLGSKPRDSEASTYEKFVANFSSGIRAPADFKDLSTAFKVAVKATKKLYNSWLQENKEH